MTKELLLKEFYHAQIQGGVMSLDALITNLKEIESKHHVSLSISEFIHFVGMFKGEYSKLSQEKDNG